MSTETEGLARHMAWLYPDPGKPCTCEHGLRGGRLDGVDMGRGWVRVTTDPECIHHGTGAP